MTISRLTTASLIKPLEGARVRRYTSGAAIAAGELVSMQDDGYIDPSDATATDEVVGVAIQAATAAAERIDVVTLGPVLCLAGATPGKTVFNSTDAGEPTETDAGSSTAAGWAETATILFVQPEHLA